MTPRHCIMQWYTICITIVYNYYSYWSGSISYSDIRNMMRACSGALSFKWSSNPWIPDQFKRRSSRTISASIFRSLYFSRSITLLLIVVMFPCCSRIQRASAGMITKLINFFAAPIPLLNHCQRSLVRSDHKLTARILRGRVIGTLGRRPKKSPRLVAPSPPLYV